MLYKNMKTKQQIADFVSSGLLTLVINHKVTPGISRFQFLSSLNLLKSQYKEAHYF